MTVVDGANHNWQSSVVNMHEEAINYHSGAGMCGKHLPDDATVPAMCSDPGRCHVDSLSLSLSPLWVGGGQIRIVPFKCRFFGIINSLVTLPFSE